MNCPGCSEPLRVWEQAQPTIVLGQQVPVQSYCDECCRANLWKAGSREALDRLAAGVLDPVEVARLAVATPSPYDGPPPEPSAPARGQFEAPQ